VAEGYSLSWYANEFGIARSTVAKRLTAAGVEPVGAGPKGAVLYRLRDAAPVLVGPAGPAPDDDAFDPERLPPLERQQWMNSEKARIQGLREHDKLLRERNLLLEYDNVEFGIAALLKRLREGVLLMPDVIEAEAGLAPRQREAMNRQIDVLLGNLRAGVQELFVSGDGDDELPQD
jgi:hypothetical protein